MSSDQLRRPPEWPSSTGGRYVVACAFLGVVVVLVPLALTLRYYQIDRPAAATYAAAVAVVGGLILWVGFETRLRRNTSTDPITLRRAEDGTATLEIPYSPRIYLGYGLLMGAIALVFGKATVDSLTSDDPAYATAAYVFGVVVLLFGSLPLLMATGRFARGYLRLSPEGIYQRGWTFESFLPWSGLVAIIPRYADCPMIVVVAEDDTPWRRRQITRLWRQDKLPKITRDDRQGLVPMIAIPGKFLSVDPTLVYHLLGFYLNNPGSRSELGSESAVRRAQSGAFG